MTQKEKGESQGHIACQGRRQVRIQVDAHRALSSSAHILVPVENRKVARVWTRKLGGCLIRETLATICTTLSDTPSVPSSAVTHPPLGERKSESSSSPAPNIAPTLAGLEGGSRSASRSLPHLRREMPRRRAAFRQNKLSHGGLAERRPSSGEDGAKANRRTSRARALVTYGLFSRRGDEIRGSSEILLKDWPAKQGAG